jgi:hypothetical protein
LRRELAFFFAPPAPDERVDRAVDRLVRLLRERVEVAFFADTRRDDFFAAELRDDFFAEVRREVARADVFAPDLRPLDLVAMKYSPLEALLMSDDKQP